uniref:Nef n=1 Tax=Human immunodeficiency virus type 1 TaxID=11676 RepID=C7G2R7_HV1|nr:Nef [Human immunodeficiency virus 1]
MGGKWSKSSIVGWPAVRERIRQTPARADERRRQNPAAAEGVGPVSQDLARHGAAILTILPVSGWKRKQRRRRR